MTRLTSVSKSRTSLSFRRFAVLVMVCRVLIPLSFESNEFYGRRYTRKCLFSTRNSPGVHEKRRHHFLRRQNLVGPGKIAEPRREIYGLPNMVIPFEEDHTSRSDSGTKRHRRLQTVGLDHLDDSLDDRLRLDPNEHRPISEPLRDPHTVNRCQAANVAADRLQQLNCSCVAFAIGECGETRDVDEREGALNTCHSTDPHDIAHFDTILSP